MAKTIRAYNRYSLAPATVLGIDVLVKGKPPFGDTVKARVKEDKPTTQSGFNHFYAYELVKDIEPNRQLMTSIIVKEREITALEKEVKKLRAALSIWDTEGLREALDIEGK